MRYEFGDVVLVPFPFTNQASSKRRPAIIVSSKAYNLARPASVVMAVTSQLRPDLTRGEVGISQWQAAGLIKPSVIKPIFATLEQIMIIRLLGELSGIDHAALRNAIAAMLS